MFMRIIINLRQNFEFKVKSNMNIVHLIKVSCFMIRNSKNLQFLNKLNQIKEAAKAFFVKIYKKGAVKACSNWFNSIKKSKF